MTKNPLHEESRLQPLPSILSPRPHPLSLPPSLGCSPSIRSSLSTPSYTCVPAPLQVQLLWALPLYMLAPQYPHLHPPNTDTDTHRLYTSSSDSMVSIVLIYWYMQPPLCRIKLAIACMAVNNNACFTLIIGIIRPTQVATVGI